MFMRIMKVSILTVSLLLAIATSSDEQSVAPQPLKTDAVFAMMSNQIVDVVCDAPEFRACFDVPQTECSRELRNMLAECRASLADEIPELIQASEADPIIEKTYACVIPKWDALIKDRRIESDECKAFERASENEDKP